MEQLLHNVSRALLPFRCRSAAFTVFPLPFRCLSPLIPTIAPVAIALTKRAWSNSSGLQR